MLQELRLRPLQAYFHRTDTNTHPAVPSILHMVINPDCPFWTLDFEPVQVVLFEVLYKQPVTPRCTVIPMKHYEVL